MGIFSHDDDEFGSSDRELTEEELIVQGAFYKYADSITKPEKESPLSRYGYTIAFCQYDSVVSLVEYFKQNNVNPLDYLTQ